MLGIAISFTPGLITEARLREPVRHLELFAKTARRTALTKKQTYEIKFTERGFSILPFSTTNTSPTETTEQEETQESTYELPSKITCQIQPWGEKDWQDAKDQNWIFQSSGLCQPLSVRFTRDESWIILPFSPLTAGVEKEEYHFE